MNIAEIRQKYPQYNHVDDQKLADALYDKYYVHVPKEEFYKKIDFTPQANEEQISAPERTGLGAVGRDVAESFVSAPGAGLKALQGLPEWLESIGQYRQEKGLAKSLGQTAIGGIEDIAKLLSLPQVGARYVYQKATGSKESRLHKAPTPYEFLRGLEADFGLSPKSPQEEAIRSTSAALIPGMGTTKAARAALFSGEAAGAGRDPIHAALASLFGEKVFEKAKSTPGKIQKVKEFKQEVSNIPEIEKIVEDAAQKYGLNENDLGILKDELKRNPNIGTSELPSIQRKQQISQQAISQNKPISEQLFDENKEPIIPQNTTHVAQKAFDEAISRAQKFLGKGQEHDEIAFRNIIKDFEENVKSKAQQLYNKNNELLRDEKMVMPSRFAANKDVQDLKDLINTEGWGSIQASSLAKEIEKMSPDKEIPAKEFYTLARDARQTANATRRAAYGKTAQEFDRLIEKADKLDEKADSMFSLLEDAPFGEEVMNNLLEANNIWATLVKPVENNSLYKQMANKGMVSGKILPKLRGTEPGIDIINQLIQKNPETLKSIISHSYAESPIGLLGMNQREQALAHQVPGIREILTELEDTRNNLEQSKQNFSMEKERYRHLKKQFQEAQKKNKTISDARSVIETQSKILSDLNKAEIALKAQLSKTSLSKQKHAELSKRLEDIKNKKGDIRSKITNAAKVGLSLVGLNKVTKFLL